MIDPVSREIAFQQDSLITLVNKCCMWRLDKVIQYARSKHYAVNAEASARTGKLMVSAIREVQRAMEGSRMI